MVTGNGRTLAILTNDPGKVFQKNVIAGAQAEAERQGYRVQVAIAPQGVRDVAGLPLDVQRLAGLLVIANVVSDDVLLALEQTGLPMSLVSHSVPGSTIPAIISDNLAGMDQLMDHIIVDCGRQRLLFIQGHMGQNDGIARDRAFRHAMVRHNLAPEEAIFVPGEFDPEVAASRLAEVLQARPSFDAIVASDYLMAVAALETVRAAGYAVPEDVCIAGFGDGPEAAAAGVTTVAADVVDLGRRACRQLIGQLNGLAIRGVTILSTELIQRETTAPARRVPTA
ncbi:MAG: LacI family DNA-binding transcriptional regulator [Chloroflexota bacterium]|nr:MAG: hypothetical protein DIU68_11915 [Chloroflexota bacterium]